MKQELPGAAEQGAHAGLLWSTVAAVADLCTTMVEAPWCHFCSSHKNIAPGLSVGARRAVLVLVVVVVVVSCVDKDGAVVVSDSRAVVEETTPCLGGGVVVLIFLLVPKLSAIRRQLLFWL